MSALRPTHMPQRATAYRDTGAWGSDTVWTAFAGTAARRAGATAVVDDAVRLDFATLATRAEAVSGGLAALGVRAGDAVAFQLPNWWETVVVLLATMRLGAIATPILPIARERELRWVLGRTGARVCFVAGSQQELVAAARGDLPALAHVVVVRGEGTTTWNDVARGSAPPGGDPGDVALLIHTSGSTADPKGVLHSHQTLLAEARSLGPAHAIGPDDVVLMPSPLTHISGIVHALLVPAAFGTCAVLMPRWDAGAALALIAAERVTYMVGAPTFLRDLAQHPALPAHDVGRFRLFSCGGADVDPTLVTEAAARLGCVAKRVYGSTEFPTIATTTPDDPPARRIDSEGRPLPGVEIVLVDDDGAPVAPGVEGEILARGPDCCLGYHDATMNADTFADDDWFRTGDLGTRDAGGWLRITGRKKDIIIRKGENISAREVEDLLASHPAVAEVAVIGVPDAAAGEIACAVVRVRSGAAAPTLSALCEHLLACGLSKRKLPERLRLVTTFPRTDSGKILKRALQDAWHPWRARIAVGAVFFANGAGMASWVPHVPAVQMGLGLRPSVLGLALLAMAVGALLGIPLSGYCSARWGSGTVVRLTALAFFVVLPLPLVAPDLGALVAALFLLGASNGALDVSMNTQAVAVEHRWTRPILSSFHGLWSLGGLAGAGVASLALHAGVSPRAHVAAAAVVLGATALVACRDLLPRAESAHDGNAPHFARPTRALALLGTVAFFGLLAEGAVGDWSAVYLRSALGADAGTAALGFAAFSATMAAGRFIGDRLVARLGDATLVRSATGLGALAFGAALLVGTPVAAIAGCAALGLGLANLVPIVFRAASRVPGVPPSHGIAAVGTAGYAGFLAGPPVIGFVAEAVTVGGALWILVVALGWIAVVATRLRRAGDSPSSPAS